MIATAAHGTFAGARLLEPIDRHQHIQFIERRIAGNRLVDAPTRPMRVVGDVACREFVQAFPCPAQSHRAEEQDWVDWSLRKWAKRAETHSTDQNHLCESRYNRHIFCSGKIPPANQTVAVWQMGIPRVPDVLPPPTLLELIQREKRLIREQRESRFLFSQLIHDYELWREEQPSESPSHSEWNNLLLKHGLPKELDFLRFIPPKKTNKQEEEEGFEPEENAFRPERSPDDEKVGGSEFDHINNNGVRETTKDVPNDVNRRSQYQQKYLHVVPYNPVGKVRTEEAEQAVRNHPDFLVDAARRVIQMTNTSIVEVAAEMGVDYDWLRQQLSRGNQKLDVYQTNPDVAAVRELIGNRKTPIPIGFNISIRLNDTAELKYLGMLTDSPETYLKALARHQKATIKDALKYVGRKARTHGWTAERVEAEKQVVRARIEEAYRPHFEWFQREVKEGRGTLSQFPHKVEGRSSQHYA